MIQQRIPNYDFVREIGHGVFGYVFEAYDYTNKRKVAIKRIEKKENILSREYQILFELQGYPNIVQLTDFFYTRNDRNELIQNMVFEYLETNLESLMRKCIKLKKRIDEQSIKILQGLKGMHSKGVCHRDLKPENILLNDQDEIRICDFGSAKVLDQNGLNSPYVVTQYYRAPELLFSHTNYDTSIDIWALGTIMYELITLEVLFQGNSEGDQLFQFLQILGSPEEDTIDYLLSKVEYKTQLKIRFIGYCPQDLSYKFQHLKQGQQFMDLMMKMIKYNPKERISAEEAMNHQLFLI